MATNKLFQIPQAQKYLSTFLPRLAEKRVQSFTTLVLSLITLSFFGIFAISPTLATIADLQKQISDNEFVNNQLRVKIINLTTLQQSYKIIQSQLSVLYSAVPQNPDVTTLIGQIQTIATSANVTLVSMQTLPVAISQGSTARFNSFTFSLDVSGNYAQIKDFLQKLTTFNRLMTIDAISLNQPVANQDSYTLSLRGDVYFAAKP